ncbi:MAG TPA: S24/S26 family peptidase [Burkholderiaceae bacterium]|nr:S24/S26 family peptidase [Burkholderiaceae bacterium]
MDAAGRLGDASDREADRLDGLGAFIWQERERVRAAVDRRGPGDSQDSTVECRIRGGSMEAAIPRGSRIRITFTTRQPRVGDIVAFMIGERIVVHRVVHLTGRHVLTRGDAMLLPDPPIEPAAVLGEVSEIDSGSGWSVPAAQSRPPRRDRLLAFVVLMASRLLLRFNRDLARRFIEWLDAADHRHAWTRKLLY